MSTADQLRPTAGAAQAAAWNDIDGYLANGARLSSMAGPSFDAYSVGAIVGAVGVRLERKITQPPAAYSQDTLLDAMVNAAQFARNDQEREMLRRCDGLGTSRTRVPMIEALIERGLLVTRQVGRRWEIHISDMGYQVLDQVPDELRSVAMTARWEIALGGIKEGRYEPAAVIAKGYELVGRLVEHIRRLKELRDASLGGVVSATAATAATAATVVAGQLKAQAG